MFLTKQKLKTVFVKISIHEPTLPMMRCRVEEAIPDGDDTWKPKLIGDTLFTADETGDLFSHMFEGLMAEDNDTIFVVMRDRISEKMTNKRRNGFQRFWDAVTA